MNIDCTLIGDGSSDKMLIPSIKWLLQEYFPQKAINIEYADLRPILPKKASLEEKICLAIELFPCDLLFVHRDVEKETYQKRQEEIDIALKKVQCSIPKTVSVIPCRMSEAWLIIDANAIRIASGNPNGKISLNLPNINQLETLPNPKRDLEVLLKNATELNKKRLKRFNVHYAIHRVAENISDYSPLRKLSAFQALESQIEQLNLD